MIAIDEKLLTGYSFIDLFSGLGGFRIALESLGAKCVYASDCDEEVQKIYELNFGERPAGDITKISAGQIPNHDIICAGFPCQAFSISGKQKGFKDSRGKLFFEVVRIIKVKRPKIIFMENVKNFATHNEGRTLNLVRKTIESLGYQFNYKILNAADYGIAQNRERIYIVCFRNDLNLKSFSYPKSINLTNHVEDYLLNDESLLKNLYVDRKDIKFNGKIDDEYSNKIIRLGIVNKGGQGERIYSVKGIAITLSAYGGGVFAKTGGYLINNRIRKLHPRECARLMGFTDDYILSENLNQSYKQLGNSIVIDVVQLIAQKIGNALKKISKE